MTETLKGKEQCLNVTSLDALAEHGIKRVCVAIGVFDGVHKGHQLLLRQLVEMARLQNAAPVAMTFYPHPRAVLFPNNPPPLLVSPDRRIRLLHEYGAEAVVTLSFSESFARQTPDEFIRNCLHTPRVEIKGLCVGREWRFGASGTGDVEMLHDLARKNNFVFAAVNELLQDNVAVSSTSIRRAIAAGLLQKAAAMLGRPYTLSGRVKKGHQVAGSELGHPTANLKIKYGVLPPCGVYAAKACVNHSYFPAGVNIGVSPTYNRPEDKSIRVEAHLLDHNGNIYGRQMELALLEYLREERCFSTPAELKMQIDQDIDEIRKIVISHDPKSG
ncbi:riboflavin biosynthesis protein RibF [Lentisphaerota bacterium ZTH]|nr:riboflavin biosynthesis protein RibF [Lentisphaerota bacterium]WET06343.1 riboflavin biosynthesis protein RibF [Lentisphaerota bacterium ZTH]